MPVTMSGIITVGIFVLLHTGALIYWMSKINTTLDFVVKRLDLNEMHRYNAIDASRDFALRDQQIKVIFQRLEAT